MMATRKQFLFYMKKSSNSFFFVSYFDLHKTYQHNSRYEFTKTLRHRISLLHFCFEVLQYSIEGRCTLHQM